MWVFLNDAFLSIIDPAAEYGGGNGPAGDTLLVRARFAGDLERAFGDEIRRFVEHTPDRDYAYRARVKRERVATALADAARGIDYRNFKGSTRETWRHDVYMRCWSAMEAEQRRRLPRPKPSSQSMFRDLIDQPRPKRAAKRRG